MLTTVWTNEIAAIFRSYNKKVKSIKLIWPKKATSNMLQVWSYKPCQLSENGDIDYLILELIRVRKLFKTTTEYSTYNILIS
jgi:hypothetical protein